jgi:hypothetical protein
MEIINHRGKKFIEINGKQFYLQQAFLGEKWGKDPAFLQVYGKVPLRYEDLPDKKWLIIKTRTPGQQKKGEPREYIYTAYDRECFDYETPPYERKKDALFIGNSKPGSAFVTITSLAKICAFELPRVKALELAETVAEGKLSIRNLYLEEDLGNAGNTAYRFQFTTQNIDRWMVTAHYLKELFGLEPKKKKNGRKKS